MLGIALLDSIVCPSRSRVFHTTFYLRTFLLVLGMACGGLLRPRQKLCHCVPPLTSHVGSDRATKKATFSGVWPLWTHRGHSNWEQLSRVSLFHISFHLRSFSRSCSCPKPFLEAFLSQILSTLSPKGEACSLVEEQKCNPWCFQERFSGGR